MTEFDEIGAKCKKCGYQDYLPFKCVHCNNAYCLSHRFEHECTGGVSEGFGSGLGGHNNKAMGGKELVESSLEKEGLSLWLPQCPLCGQGVEMKAGSDPNHAVTLHIEAGCPKPLSHKHLQRLTLSSSSSSTSSSHSDFDNKNNMNGNKSCHYLPVCREVLKNDLLASSISTSCPDCSLTFCLAHRHPRDHACSSLKDLSSSSSSSSSSPTVSTPTLTNASLFIAKKAKEGNKTAQMLLRSKAKAKAIGDSSIPEADRFYLEVCFPSIQKPTTTTTKSSSTTRKPSSSSSSSTSSTSSSKPITKKPPMRRKIPTTTFMFFKPTNTIGKVIDQISEYGRIPNLNDRDQTNPLMLYDLETGKPLDPDLQLRLTGLAPYQSVLLEYKKQVEASFSSSSPSSSSSTCAQTSSSSSSSSSSFIFSQA